MEKVLNLGTYIKSMGSEEVVFPERRSRVFARNMVATSQPLAAQSGVDALRRGGNAVDAAIAMAITLTVVEPNNNGVGSDAFAQVWDGATLHGVNGSGRSPADWSPDRFSDRDRMPTLGWDAVTVPGAVSVWRMLSERFGRLAFADLFRDAIHYARSGFQVGPISAYFWDLTVRHMDRFPDFLAHFAPHGRAPRPGELFRRPELADSLELIADSGGEAFYSGALATAIAEHARAAGAALTFEDLASHRADWVTPIAQSYHGVSLHEIPPNGQGLAAQIALALLEPFDLGSQPLGSAESIHLQIEAMKIAITAAFDHFADPRAMVLPVKELLDPESLRLASASISQKASTPAPVKLPVSLDTVCLAAADEEGMMVSFIQSNYLGFGSGVVIPGTGIAMQNRGRGFSLEEGHPNRVDGSKRPFHTIIPGFVTQAGEALLSFGVMGGHMQHQGHVQMVHRMFDHDQDPQSASDAPRWQVFEDMSIGLEAGFPVSVAEDLAARGHSVRFVGEAHVFGGAQLIQRVEGGYCGGSDHRKEGQVAGF